MPILKDLQKLLEKNNIKHEIIDHKRVYTAIDSALTQHIRPSSVVKALVLKIDAKKYVLALLPANRNLNKERFLKEANKWLKSEGLKAVKSVEFAKEAWMKKNIKGKIGATVPLGSVHKMATFIDKSLLNEKDLVINTGDYEKSIKIATKKFVGLEKMIRGAFSEAKKKLKKK